MDRTGPLRARRRTRRAGAPRTARVQRLEQRTGRDQARASGVDQGGGGFHARQVGGGDDAAGGGHEAQVQAEEISFGEERLAARHNRSTGRGGASAAVFGAPPKDLHSEHRGDVADSARNLAVAIKADSVRPATPCPTWVCHWPVRAGDLRRQVAGCGEHQGDGQLDGRRAGTGGGLVGAKEDAASVQASTSTFGCAPRIATTSV